MSAFSLSTWSEGVLRSSSILRTVDWQLVTDVSRKSISPIFFLRWADRLLYIVYLENLDNIVCQGLC